MSKIISFDYAIKFLLRDKSNYGIVEGFISALLKSFGYGKVKIVSLIESESNKEDQSLKKSLADLIVKDESSSELEEFEEWLEQYGDYII